MLPSILAEQLRQGLADYLRATFEISTPYFNTMLEEFLAEKGALFRGAYLQLGLPFRRSQVNEERFTHAPLGFTPWMHQEQAFQRLAAEQPRSTIVATGTGSGKTECFLHPILEYCAANPGPGVKAVLIYPMNALATDQAARIARTVHSSPGLRNRVTAGLYIGGSKGLATTSVMTPDSVVTDRETMRLRPPNLLLTNYKMLDYLLLRPADAVLWVQNEPETLRFVVVDELHTFDGAQGTDLACLLRRLKDRLKTPEGHLCCVGTSATLGSPSSGDSLRRYAEMIFGESFDKGALITESRESAGEFLGEGAIQRFDVPGPEHADELEQRTHPGYSNYVLAQHRLWFNEAPPVEDFDKTHWRVELAARLKGHLFFQNLVRIARSEIVDMQLLGQELARAFPQLADSPDGHDQLLLRSMLALVAEARAPMGDAGTERVQPFLHVRIQLWLREMRRMVAGVGKSPVLRHAHDLTEDQLGGHLPVLHCRECGSMYWSGLRAAHEYKVRTELQPFYAEFFSKNPTKVIRLAPEEQSAAPGSTEPDTGSLQGTRYGFCTSCLRLCQPDREPDREPGKDAACPHCREKSVLPVIEPEGPVKDCPQCGSFKSLTVVGHQAATLTSVLISQYFSSPFNEFKKLLTFSDNVQDAAHRAGFFGARTYRTTFRTALQQYLLQEGAGQTLEEAAAGFVSHYRQHMPLDAFVATFLPPNLSWLSDYEYFREHGKEPENSRLLECIENRMQWEVCAEFGFNSRIGRTLEKAQCSIAHPDPELLGRALDLAFEHLRNVIGQLRELQPQTLQVFLLGLLHTMRQRGAVFWPVLEGYVQDWGKTFRISQGFKSGQVLWMPNFGPKTRAPAFLTTKRGTERFDALFAAGNGASWYEHWAMRTLFAQHPMARNMVKPAYEVVLDTLCKTGILDERTPGKGRVWGLRPQALRIDLGVERLGCDRCGHGLMIQAQERDNWEDAPCMRRYCRGVYRPSPGQSDFYASLYSTGDVKRIFPEEHTGLLDRVEREEIERQFKEEAEPKPWYTNLLSCTPTLEMGINIGELSGTFQCSVPPAQANYLQRVGRAGRKDGNALNVTVANASPHDLYFYAEPEEMMRGEMDPPGVYLDASAVLERQFTAYCFDRWVATGATETALPPQIKTVLHSFGSDDPARFPYNLLSFIGATEAQLLEDFLELFTETLSEDSRQHLAGFAHGGSDQEGSLRCKVLDGLAGLQKELKSLKGKVDRVTRAISKLKKNPAKDQNYETELEQLKSERTALNALIRSINDKNTLNFFTDEGLLPNYAFPEAGVTLRSVILRKQRISASKERSTADIFEYDRAASSAIRDLAPENRFYAGGRVVEVDQIDLNVSSVEEWRLCANCSHMEPVAGEEVLSSCPRCGDLDWPDTGRKHKLVKLRQVVATTPDWKSRIADDADNREPVFYSQQMLVDTDDANIRDAFRIDDDSVPFGVEFLNKASIRELNFGKNDDSDVPPTLVAGKFMSRKGFWVCRHCGQVQKSNGPEHANGCPKKGEDSDKNFTECIYLYREFDSEALKMLLPVLSLDGSETKVHSFIAALQLGLKLKFGGRIDHLRATMHSDPLPDSKIRKQYLLVYDTVPGGTGYLKQLMREETIFEVLQLAYDRILGCTCASDPAKDGCYSCLFAYRNSHTMSETSRASALSMLGDILQRKDRTVPVESLKTVRMDRLMDSILEAMFIDALHDHSISHKESSIKVTPVRGKKGRTLKFPNNTYDIEIQSELGQAEGVAVPSKVDFVFHPRTVDDAKKIVVFTDGFAFHHDRINRDTLQRMALQQSRRYLFWCLSYQDVARRSAADAEMLDVLDPADKPSGAKLHNLLQGFGVERPAQYHKGKALQQYLDFLAAPDLENYAKLALAYALTFAGTERGDQARERLMSALRSEGLEQASQWMAEELGSPLYAAWNSGEPTPFLKFFGVFPEECLRNKGNVSDVRLIMLLEDSPEHQEQEEFEKAWRMFLRCMNLFQFIPGARFFSRKGLEQNLYEDSLWQSRLQQAPAANKEVEASQLQWNLADIAEMTDGRLHRLLHLALEKGTSEPEPGFELVDEKGTCIAFAELAFAEERLAVLLQDDEQSLVAFSQAGWRTGLLEDVSAAPEAFLHNSNA